jgi:repressor LexA
MIEKGEATVKQFFKEKSHIRLSPENLTMEPILLPSVMILGKVIEVSRNIQ